MKTVMITGTGAIIGYGVLKALREARPDFKLVAADIFPDAVGQYWADAFEVAPLTSDVTYKSWLRDCIEKHNVDLLIPGIEQDLFCYASDPALLSGLNVRVVLNRSGLINQCRDKWLMHESLRSLGHPVRIPSRLRGEFEDLADAFGLPFLLKPRVGYASKGLIRVLSREDFEIHSQRLGDELMAQPIVGSDEEEYTVGVFGDGKGAMNASITLQRKLSKEGATSTACVRHLPDLDEVIKELCASFCPIGPTNFQFRRDAGKWWLLEINPRISSSTSLRAAFGYNEADLCVQHYLENKQVKQPVIRDGHAVRYIADMVTFENDCTDF